MRLEVTLENWAVDVLREKGAHPIKMGQAGQPDRLVLWGRGIHFWVEFKQSAKANVRPAQRVYLKYLKRIEDPAFLVYSKAQMMEIIATYELVYGRASAHRVTPVSASRR